jgi:hypothetical protein
VTLDAFVTTVVVESHHGFVVESPVLRVVNAIGAGEKLDHNLSLRLIRIDLVAVTRAVGAPTNRARCPAEVAAVARGAIRLAVEAV